MTLRESYYVFFDIYDLQIRMALGIEDSEAEGAHLVPRPAVPAKCSLEFCDRSQGNRLASGSRALIIALPEQLEMAEKISLAHL